MLLCFFCPLPLPLLFSQESQDAKEKEFSMFTFKPNITGGNKDSGSRRQTMSHEPIFERLYQSGRRVSGVAWRGVAWRGVA